MTYRLNSSAAELDALEKQIEIELIEAAETEKLLYSIAPDPLLEIFRDDLLENGHDGKPRPQWEKDALLKAWRIAREWYLPSMSYVEPTATTEVRDTEWLLLFGEKGAHKTTMGVYYSHWYLGRCPWVTAAYSTIPLYAYILDYPFVLRDNQGKRLLHPKYRPIRTLREIGRYENALVFMDEIANLMPGRNFSDRTQWLVTSWTRNFRKHNVILVATTQRETSPDPEMRENFGILVAPEIVDDDNGKKLTWKMWKNHDSDYSEYRSWKSGFSGVRATEYPDDDLDGNYPLPKLPWLYAAFDSRLEVPILFQEPLEKSRVEAEARSLRKWIDSTDTGGVNSSYYSRGEVPPDSDFRRALDAWNVSEQKMYDSDELLLIGQDFRRLNHAPVEVEEAQAKLRAEREGPKSYECECGFAAGNRPDVLERHISGVRNIIFGLTTRRLPEARVVELRTSHPKLVQGGE